MAQSSKRTWARTNQANWLLGEAYKGANTALQQGYDQSRSDVTSGTDQARSDISSGTSQAQSYLTDALSSQLRAYQSGADNAINALNQSDSLWQPYYDNGTSASNMLTNALGLNGSDGNTAAQNAFTTSPGYEWQVNQSLDSATRKANATGMAASGNMQAELATIASGLANQEWSNWLSNLSSQQSVGTNAAAALTANNTNKADVYSTLGELSGNAYSTTGTKQANLAADQGTALANLAADQGTTLGNLATNYYGDQANLGMGTFATVGDRMISQGQSGDSAANANDSINTSLIGGVGKTLLSGLTGGLGSVATGGSFLTGLGNAWS